MDNNEEILRLKSELAKAQAEAADLRAKLDAQNKGFDVQAALDRIKSKAESDATYKAEMEAKFNALYGKDSTPSNPQTTRFF